MKKILCFVWGAIEASLIWTIVIFHSNEQLVRALAIPLALSSVAMLFCLGWYLITHWEEE